MAAMGARFGAHAWVALGLDASSSGYSISEPTISAGMNSGGHTSTTPIVSRTCSVVVVREITVPNCLELVRW